MHEERRIDPATALPPKRVHAARNSSEFVALIISAMIIGAVEALVVWLLTNFHWVALGTALLYAVPAALLFLSAVLYARSRAVNESNGSRKHPGATSDEFAHVLDDMGITGCIPHLDESRMTPTACMKRTHRTISFMGILASKWVSPGHMRTEFCDFLSRIENYGGEVRFLLINPSGQAFTRLKHQREGAIDVRVIEDVKALVNEFSCFHVRLYDNLPCFRLVFIDNNELALSLYKITKQGHFESKYGWAVPHLMLVPQRPYSLYDAFELYFQHVWSSSVDIRTY